MQEFSRVITLILPILIPGLILILILRLNWLRFLDIPIDLRKSLGGKRIFGDNKTIKGIVVMTAMGIAVVYVLNLGLESNLNLFIDPIFKNQPVIIGLIYSISYMTGELINSFVKRRLDIPSGQSNSHFRDLQNFFDLSDGIIVTALVLTLITSIRIFEVVLATLIGISLHYFTDYLMKRMHLK